MAFDVVTYLLSKKYADKIVAALPQGLHYKGAKSYYADLPSDATVGDVYTIVYKGEAPSTETWGAEFVWGEYQGAKQWIRIGTDREYTVTIDL